MILSSCILAFQTQLINKEEKKSNPSYKTAYSIRALLTLDKIVHAKILTWNEQLSWGQISVRNKPYLSQQNVNKIFSFLSTNAKISFFLCFQF